MAALLISVTLAGAVFLPVNMALLLKSQVGGEDGHCVWYDTCGKSPTTGYTINCDYSGPAKPLTNQTGLDIYKEYCPDLYKIQNEKGDPMTCCSAEQLTILKANMGVPKQVLSRCPSCFHNFVNLYCYFTCAPDHSKFMQVNKTTVTPEAKAKNTKAVTVIDCDVSTHFSHGMYNSCQSVQMPSANERALGVLCGRSADQCTPENWLAFMGSTANGQTPFQINFFITDKNRTTPAGNMTSLDGVIVPCSVDVTNDTNPCSCLDCPTTACPVTPMPYFPCTSLMMSHHDALSSFGYEPIHLLVGRRGRHPPVKHNLPPPSSTTVDFNPVFNKTFLHKVLNLTTVIQTMNATLNKDSFTLNHVCLHGNASKHCITPSVLQYFQNSHKKLDKIIIDSSGFFIMSDYLDHLMTCSRGFAMDGYNMSCLADYGEIIQPSEVLCDYEGVYFGNATTLVMTFVIKDPRHSITGAVWKDALVSLVKRWSDHHPDLKIKIY